MKLKTTLQTAALVGACVALLAGCKKEEGASNGEATSAVPFNASCPIQPENGVSLRTPTVVYKGTTIGFCCPDCPATWEEWPESKKDEYVAAQKKAMAENAPTTTEDPDH